MKSNILRILITIVWFSSLTFAASSPEAKIDGDINVPMVETVNTKQAGACPTDGNVQSVNPSMGCIDELAAKKNCCTGAIVNAGLHDPTGVAEALQQVNDKPATGATTTDQQK